MDIKACEKCGSFDTSEDTSTGKHTCLKCGEVTKGTSVDFFGTMENEKIMNPRLNQNPFNIQSRIMNNKKLM